MSSTPRVFRFGDFALDVARREVTRDGAEVALQPKVFETLLHLVRHADRVVGKDELLETLWAGTVVTEDVLTRAVSALRRALGDDARAPRYVRAERGVGYRFVAPVRATAEPRSSATRALAVFPVRAVAAGEADDLLRVGLADTLVARLGRLRTIVVRPLASSAAALEAHADPGRAAAALGVDAYLDASLQEARGRLRVNARVVTTADDACLWSESFDESIDDLFVLQDALCERIVERLVPSLVDDDVEAGVGRAGVDTEAYRSFVEGRVFMARHTPADLHTAVERFESALDVAPAYADAWAALGESHDLLATLGERNAAVHVRAARRAAARALALAPSLPEADALVAKLAWQYDWNWGEAETRFARALARSPNRADLHIHYADFLGLTGEAERGTEHARRAVEIDPVSPWCNTLLAQSLYLGGEYEAALEQATRALELAPGFAFAEFYAGLVEYQLDRRESGVGRVEAAAASGRADFAGALGVMYADAGRPSDAREVLAKLSGAHEPPPPFAVAIVHAAVGDDAEAAAALDLCHDQRDWHILLLATDPLLSRLRERPPVRAILDRMDLPERRG